jgi:L-threonylcarbamoyladenylate synthase
VGERVKIEPGRGGDQAHHALERTIVGGGVALFPADGLYGLACDPLNEEAIRRIHSIKGRAEEKPSAVLYFSLEPLREVIDSMSPLVRAVAAAVLPGPVTLVIDNPDRRYPLACGDDPSRLGIRHIDGPLAGVVTPVFQTSANLSGEEAPAAFSDIPESIVEGVDLAIDGGELTGKPSTVLDVTAVEAGGAWKVLREGAVSYEELEAKLTGLSLGG